MGSCGRLVSRLVSVDLHIAEQIQLPAPSGRVLASKRLQVDAGRDPNPTQGPSPRLTLKRSLRPRRPGRTFLRLAMCNKCTLRNEAGNRRTPIVVGCQIRRVSGGPLASSPSSAIANLCLLPRELPRTASLDGGNAESNGCHPQPADAQAFRV